MIDALETLLSLAVQVYHNDYYADHRFGGAAIGSASGV
jgi:hypothetical protein